jgi:hypothetical protein
MILVNYKDGIGAHVPVAVSGRETGIGGNKVLNFEYSALQPGEACAVNMQAN